jgi:hypothetical protein
MNAPVRAPRIEHDRFAALLAATPAPVATGGVVRVAHCLERAAVASIPTALREHLKGLEAEEGRVTWSKVDDGLWIRSVLCVERGPTDHALTRAFELAVAEGWFPAGSWRRVATKGALRCVEVGAGAPRGSLWIYAVKPEVATRTLVLGTGEVRYTRRREGTHYGPWEWATPRRAWLDVVDLACVQFAAPDPVVALVPGRFAVGASRWCDWPKAAREALRLAAPWTKRPGVMGTDWLDGETAERVRSIAAQWSLQGLEETEGT